MSSELNNVLIKIKNKKIHINKFIKFYFKITNFFISKKELIKTLDNNKNIILYKNIIIIDNLEVEHDFIEFIENLNIDFLENLNIEFL